LKWAIKLEYSEITAVRKELLRHFLAAFVFITLVLLAKGWFELTYLTIFLGGVVGTLLPDLDHLIYVFFLAPQELSSQRVGSMVAKRNFWEAVNFLAETRMERKELIFHTIFFQLLFIVVTFFVITSSGSVFGRGLVLAFSLHFLVDQLVDFRETGGIDNWFYNSPLKIPEGKIKLYLWAVLAILLFLGLFL
jgi:hypothetical protein